MLKKKKKFSRMFSSKKTCPLNMGNPCFLTLSNSESISITVDAMIDQLLHDGVNLTNKWDNLN